MTSPLYRFSFLLPPALALVKSGRHHPCLHACTLTIGNNGVVVAEGPSRERVFEQVIRFFRVLGRDLPPTSIAAVLKTPAGHGLGGQDGWNIIVGAGIAFSPTSLPPYLAEKFAAPDPPLTVLASG